VTYVILIGLVLAVGALAFYYGYRLDALERDLKDVRAFSQKQADLLEAWPRIQGREHELEKVLDALRNATTPEEFSSLLNAYVSGSAQSSITGNVA
jgi:hypothetical protein